MAGWGRSAHRPRRAAVAVAADDDGSTGTDGARLPTELADAARDRRAAPEALLDRRGASGFEASNPAAAVLA